MQRLNVRFDDLYKNPFYEEINNRLKEYAISIILFWAESLDKNYTQVLRIETKIRIEEVINTVLNSNEIEDNFRDCSYILYYYSSLWSKEEFKNIINEVIEEQKNPLIWNNKILRESIVIKLV